ncbi:hypothetical protein EYC84_004058 [Monilinia fructicola]|uniref:Uncharacterized protein n=1 Tax=Monilinia fructicola TaxID=38448 RepID=A0A5M9JZY2_MONFR|nr:hypothetical protein EYC84_004058 [Monilinia fructicola]
MHGVHSPPKNEYNRNSQHDLIYYVFILFRRRKHGLLCFWATSVERSLQKYDMPSHRSSSSRISVHGPDYNSSEYPTFQQHLRNQDAAVDLIAERAASIPWIGPPKGGFVVNENGYSRPYVNATIFAKADTFGKATIAFECAASIDSLAAGDILNSRIRRG